jgi:replicative superfamily II helicase
MNISKFEIFETHFFVSTPEKSYVVVGRKTDGLTNPVNFLINDEICLINEGEGLARECIIARSITNGGKSKLELLAYWPYIQTTLIS